jgi:hypothetical protein
MQRSRVSRVSRAGLRLEQRARESGGHRCGWAPEQRVRVHGSARVVLVPFHGRVHTDAMMVILLRFRSTADVTI